VNNSTADRFEIEEALRHYAFGLDERQWHAWQKAFASDAVIDFSPMGGVRQTPAEMIARLSEPDSDWLFAQHPLINTIIEFEGDEAVARSDFLMETGRSSSLDGVIIRVSGGGSYVDRLRRTEAGWRIYLREVRMKWKETRRVKNEARLGSASAQR
jgi:3-phenylpropionate/cinnamic acid dioxygenase small subunit